MAKLNFFSITDLEPKPRTSRKFEKQVFQTYKKQPKTIVPIIVSLHNGTLYELTLLAPLLIILIIINTKK